MIDRKTNMLSVLVATFVSGFSAIVAQVYFMRELVVIFNGNELSLGVILGVWLLWTSGLFLLDRCQYPRQQQLDRKISSQGQPLQRQNTASSYNLLTRLIIRNFESHDIPRIPFSCQ